MNLFRWVAQVGLFVSLVACTPQPPRVAPVAQPTAPPITSTSAPSKAVTLEEKIKNALSAAPASVAKEAIVVDYPTDPAKPMVELRKGSNGWTCFTDWPATPGDDPQCMDATWMEWMDALAVNKAYTATKAGIGYMLMGGIDPSNTDPMAVAPASGEDWVISAPHLMIITPGDLDPKVYTTDHKYGGPYIMFAGSPFAHIMMPVNGAPELMGNANPPQDKEAKIKNAMSAGPLAISKDATIVEYPTGDGKPLVELRKGTNSWTCFVDWPASPGNDPQCIDEVWMRWSDAIAAHQPFSTTRIGLGYMLAGGSDPSEDDPFAVKPATGENWVTSPPHVMLIFPGKLNPKQFASGHATGKPYIMFAGTPYEHVMVPVDAQAH